MRNRILYQIFLLIGFLLIEIDLSYMLEVSFDSCDEDNYLIDIWKYNE